MAAQVTLLDPSLHLLLLHAFVEQRHLDCSEALRAVHSDWIEFSAHAERALMFFPHPGGKAWRMVRVSAESDDIAVLLQADGAGLLCIDMVRKRIVHVVVCQVNDARSRVVPRSSHHRSSIPVCYAGMDYCYEAYDHWYREEDYNENSGHTYRAV